MKGTNQRMSRFAGCGLCGVWAIGLLLLSTSSVIAHPVASIRGMIPTRSRAIQPDITMQMVRVNVPASPAISTPTLVPGRTYATLNPLVVQWSLHKQLLRIIKAQMGGLYGP